MRYKNLFAGLALATLALTTPVVTQAAPQHNRPRLVVTMMVDQMTWDYLYRYQARFVEGGFKRLLTQGFNCENTRINYLPAYTAIGHSSVHTGSVPTLHGIAGNDFFKDGNPIYCMQDLPEWVKKFNARGRVAELLKDGWNTLYPINTYRESTADAVPYEQPWDKDGKFPATLPLNTAELAKVKGPGVIRTTPFGNTLTFEMAKAAIEGESLGARTDETDFLAMSHSATDYVGHRYGTFAVETEDTYLRLDKDLASFLSYLDGRFGRDGYLFVLTADHAAAHNIAFDRDHKLPGDVFRSDLARQIADSAARAYIGRDAQVIRAYMNYQIFFRQGLIDTLGINRQGLYHAICKAIKDKLPGVAYAVPAEEVATATVPDVVKTRIINGYRKGRSGDIFLVPDPGWYSKSGTSLPQGTTHGVWSPYDTHIPLIFMGHGVRAGHLYRETYITDIAATLAALLKTQYPSGCIGHPITEAFAPVAPAAASASSASRRR